MCENDFLQLLAEAGHDVDSVKITHETWARQQNGWKSRSDAPKHYTHIRFSWDEIMWCTVLEVKSDGTYLVQLINTSIFDGRMKKGTYLVAKWNGSLRHGLSGRPMLDPIRRVKAPRTSRKCRS
jgi:hypothetical protein